MRVALNFLAFQIGWFSAVLGAANGMPWLGLSAVPFVLGLAMWMSPDWRQEVLLALGAAIFGFVVDTGLIGAGVFSPVPLWWSPPFSPPWMVMLWVNQATTLNGCLRWLRGRYWEGAAFGAIGGPLAYLGGAKLGAAAVPTSGDLVVLGITWAVAFPALLAINCAVRGRV